MAIKSFLLKRKLFRKIKGYMPLREMIVITGMRRAGKSSLLSMLFDATEGDNKLILDIENPLDRSIFEEKDYNNIFKNICDLGISSKTKATIFLDEIQSYSAIVKPLKYLYDHYDIKFVVTGSSSFYLKNLFPESLAGRKMEFELFPLDFDEFLFFKSVAPLPLMAKENKFMPKSKVQYEKRIRFYDEYLQFGGFPQVVMAETNAAKTAYLKDIFKSYFQNELLQLSNVRNISHLRDLIVLLAARCGNRFDISRLASELGITRETVYNYLAFLQGTYFFHFVSRFGSNTDKEISSQKKVYICDTGLASQLVKLSDGQQLENAAYLNLRKYGTVHYYTDKSKREIDFILPDINTCIEVKRNAIKSDEERLQKWAHKLGLAQSHIITYTLASPDSAIPACMI